MTARRRAVALLASLLLVASAVTTGVAASHGGAEPPDRVASTAADAVYVSENGDAVLVYEEERSGDGDGDVQFGASVAENLAYALVTEPVEEPPDVRGAFAASAEPTLLRANGNLSVPQPPAVRDFHLDAAAEATESNSQTDVELSATLANQEGLAQLVESVTTEGEVTMGPNRLQVTGDVDASTPVPLGEASSLAMTLREGSDAYTLDVEQSQVVGERTVDRWRNQSVARETIREQYGLADDGGTGVDGAVSLDEYALEAIGDGQYRLDASFTVTYRNVDALLGVLVTAALASEPGVTDEEAWRVADELQAAQIDEASFSFETGGGSYAASVELDVSDYDGLFLAYLDVADAIQPGGVAPSSIERARDQFEAQRAADLTQRWTWEGELAGDDAGQLRLDAALRLRTTNWAAYVDELDARDVPWFASAWNLTGESDGDRIAIAGSMRLEGQQLFENLLAQFQAGAFAEEGLAAEVDSLARSEPRRVKVEATYDADGLRIEAGAAFGNLAALRDAIASEAGASRVADVSEVVGRTEGDAQTTYVRVAGAVGAGASEDDVRALEVVDDETTIHLPGEWDREFPSMDAERARAFLGVAQADGGSGPGFGPAVAVLALLAAALVLARRR